jgi:hypothetical protein
MSLEALAFSPDGKILRVQVTIVGYSANKST